MGTRTSSFTALWAWLLSIVAVASLLGYGYYLQYVEYLDPCPLCITQRMFYMLIAGVSVLALAAYAKRGIQRFLSVLFMLSAIGGLATAGRQVWMQHLPPEKVPECGLGLTHWLQNESPLRVVALLFKGDGNCAEVQWTFLGFSIGEWSLAWFVAFFLLGLFLFFRLGSEKKIRA